jgi:hypothetical protein
LDAENKLKLENGELDISIVGYSKKIAIKALDTFDLLVVKNEISHTIIDLNDLNNTMVNPDSVAGFEEVIIGQRLRKYFSATSKSF